MGLGVGVFAGMLGIGGGTILVTLMVLVFNAQGFAPDRVLHLALGSALATIIFTSISSFYAHGKHGAVRWEIVRAAAPGMMAGTLLGSFVAEHLSSKYLALLFVAFVFYSGVQMIFEMRAAPSRQLPGRVGLSVAGLLVGILSSLVGAGGGLITIPLLTKCNVPLRQAIGTSAAFGLPIALTGAAGYAINGLSKDHLPAFSFGYVYLPAVAAIVAGTFMTVPMGARLAHRMPVVVLKRIFGIVLWLLGVKMLWPFI
jgi:uncharacterized membrane protein YfcA